MYPHVHMHAHVQQVPVREQQCGLRVVEELQGQKVRQAGSYRIAIGTSLTREDTVSNSVLAY